MILFAALAQAAAAPAIITAPPSAPAAQQGVISYPPSFFAAARPNSAYDMLLRIPGFSLDIGAQVRGFEGAAGNVLVDGQRPASKTDAIDQILLRIPTSQVERIDIIRGGAPGIDMQGKTVLANVVRKSGGGVRGLLAESFYIVGDGRAPGVVRAEASGGSNGRTWELGWKSGKGVDDGLGDGPGLMIFADGRPPVRSFIDSEGDVLQHVGTAAVETPVLGGKIRLNARLLDEKFKIDEIDTILSPTQELQTYHEIIRTHEAEVGGRFSRAFGADTDLELVGLRTVRHRRRPAIFETATETDTFLPRRQSSETIARGTLKHRFSQTFSIEAGGEAADNKLESNTRFIIDGEEVVLPAANVQVEEKRSEVFVKSTWRPFSRWTVDGSLRYESSEISSEGDVQLAKTLHFAKPRVALTWAPSAATQLRARIEREVGQLNFDDFVATSDLNTGTGVTAGNPDLNPEQAWVAEAAIEQRFWGGAAIVLTARHYKLTDAIDRGPVFTPEGDVFDRPTNIGDGTKDELALELTLPLDRLGLPRGQLKGDVTRRWSEVTDPTTGEMREISGLRPLEWNATFTHDLPRWNTTWGFEIYGAWRETYYRFNLVDTFKLKTFVKPYAEWRPRPDLSIRFELPNITGRGFRETLLIYPGARSVGGAHDVQDRDLQFARGFYVRIRKDFGG